METNITICRADPRDPAGQALMAALIAEVEGLYGGDPSTVTVIPEGVLDPGGTFVIAWAAEQPVGCGALRRVGTDGVSEIKRMYVIPQARGQRIAARILAEIETIARESGCHTLILETGTLQPAAIRLYQRSGFVPMPNYGQYKDDPTSVCLQKKIN